MWPADVIGAEYFRCLPLAGGRAWYRAEYAPEMNRHSMRASVARFIPLPKNLSMRRA